LRRIIQATGLILLTSLAAIGQAGDFHVGFKVISIYDSSRTYKPNTTISDKLHYRPIDIDLWYPAYITSSDPTASFVDLVNLLEQRSNFYDDTRTYYGFTTELLQYICASLNCTNHDTLRRVRTKSYVNAKPIAQQFPLIIYLAGFNGMSYENYLLFESLTKKGFVVASVSSIGRFPGNMTTEPEDVFEQINDADFIIDYLTKRNLGSQDVGLIGYSWGGLAATIMAMKKTSRIKAVVSLDGSEQFAYVDEEENEKITRIRDASFFKPEAISSSFLRLDSDISKWDNLPDSIYNITDYILKDKLYLKIDHSTHEDFSSLSIVLRDNITDSKYSVIQKLTIDYLMDKLKGENIFYKNIPNQGITKQFSQPTSKSVLEPIKKNTLTGAIKDRKLNLPLPYVNIGILNKDVGTTSNTKGEFELPLLESNVNDTLRISMVGFEPALIYLKDVFKKQKLTLNVRLQERTDKLREIVITDKKLTKRVLGNKTESKFFGGRFASGDLGSEIVVKIKIKDVPTYLDTFSFNISYNEGDTSTFRVNIYEIKNGLPDKSVLADNILVKISGQTGKIDVDLSRYNAIVNGDFFIGLEWVEGKSNSGVVFSSGFVNKGTFYRKASQGRWKKFPMGVGFNVTAKY
jgi:pimeloyl-ACP methyl ester carboxylesterase